MTKLFQILGMLSFAAGLIAFFSMFLIEPLSGLFYCLFGIALGLALYEIGELRERLSHVEKALHIQRDEEAPEPLQVSKPVKALRNGK